MQIIFNRSQKSYFVRLLKKKDAVLFPQNESDKKIEMQIKFAFHRGGNGDFLPQTSDF